MQAVTDLTSAATPVVSPAPISARRAEFRFESDAALERALALVCDQRWIASCSVDRERRALCVVLASAETTPPAAPLLH